MNIPIRMRLVLVTCLIMAIVLAVIGVFIAIRLKAELTATVDAGLLIRAQQLGAGVDPEEAVGAGESLIEPDEAFAQVLTTDGAIVASSSGLDDAPLVSSSTLDSLDGSTTFLNATARTTEESVPARLLVIRGGDQVTVVGASFEDQEDAIDRLVVLLAIGGLLAVALSGVAGWVVAGLALRPVDRLRREADGISSSRGQRLEVPTTRDELERLGRTLNEMLDRLDATYEKQRRFAADASHELRTPLTNLKLEVELALRGPQDAPTLTRALRSLETELDALIDMARELLDVAKANENTLELDLIETDLSGLVDRQAEAFTSKATDSSVRLVTNVNEPLLVRCDANRIRQVVANLIDNAIRHAGVGGTVELSTAVDGGDAVIRVHDTGDGFTGDGSVRAFEPFWRADEGRHRDDGGAGLGLTITRAIVAAHGGGVTAENHLQGGALLTVRIPR